MIKLSDLAKILRSKNSGPFEVTFDIFLKNQEDFQRVLSSGIFTPAKIALLYHVPESYIQTIACMEKAYGIKITMLRVVSSGTVGDRDVYGAQQAAPLMDILIP